MFKSESYWLYFLFIQNLLLHFEMRKDNRRSYFDGMWGERERELTVLKTL